MEEMQLMAIIPELILLGGSIAGLITGLFLPRQKQWIVALFTALILIAAGYFTIVSINSPAGLVFYGTYTEDPAGRLSTVFILLSALLVVVLGFKTFRHHAREAEFYALLLFSTLGLVLLTGTSDLMLLIVAFILSSIPVYTLTAFHKDAPGTEAAMKYLLMGALMGIVMLYGIAVLYGAGGASAYEVLSSGVSESVNLAVAAGLGMIMAGLVFKMGSVPGHFWVPDAAEGAPTAVAAYITTVPKIAVVIAVVRLLTEAIPPGLIEWPWFIAIISALTMTLGNLAALWQNSVRRLLAYSSISQVGYILMAVVVVEEAAAAESAMLYYLLVYGIMNIGAFAVVAALYKTRSISDYSGIFKSRPILAVSLSILLLSLVGIPPLGGFFAKLAVFAATWEGGFSWLVVLAAINTVVSIFYYLRWLLPVYLNKPQARYAEINPVATAVAYITALAILVLGLAGPLI